MLPFFAAGFVGLLFAVSGSASPTPLNSHLLLPLNEVAVRDPLDVARDPTIEKRISADFSLNHEWHNEVLFQGAWSENGEHGAQSVSLSVVCRECWTKGDVTARLTTRDIIKPVVRLELGGVEAYVDLSVDVSANAVYAINLFTSNSPVGIGFPGLSVGLVFYVDLVFSASAVLDLDGGFYVTLEEDAFLEADVFGGDISDSLFDGIGTQSFPITVRTGKATFKAALRLRVQLGAETQVPLLGISLGGGAVAGIYANIIEFVAEIETYEDCALETRQWFNLNVGAYARAGFDVEFTSIGVAPTVSTTLFDSPTWTQCWIDGNAPNTALGSGNRLTTVSAASPVAGLPTLPALGAKPVNTGVGPVFQITKTNAESLVVATTFSPQAESSFAKRPQPTLTPSPGLAVPNGNASVTPGEPALVTTVIYPTTEYVLTRCAASVLNCPGSMESKIVVTKTLDAYTTVCPPGSKVTAPPQPISFEPPVIHVITEVVHLRKLKTPIVNTYHETSSPSQTADQVDAAAVTWTSSSVALPTVDRVATVIPIVSELPVLPVEAQAENHLIHNATTPHSSEIAQMTTSPVPTTIPTAAASRLQGFWLVHVFTAIIVAIGLA